MKHRHSEIVIHLVQLFTPAVNNPRSVRAIKHHLQFLLRVREIWRIEE